MLAITPQFDLAKFPEIYLEVWVDGIVLRRVWWYNVSIRQRRMAPTSKRHAHI